LKLNVRVLSAFGDEVGNGTIVLGDHTDSAHAEDNTKLINGEAHYAIPADKTQLAIPSMSQRRDMARSIIIQPEELDMPDPKTQLGDGTSIPHSLYLATLAERDPRCLCTWTIHEYHADDHSVFALKYRNLACGAVAWHLRLENHSGQDKAA
jgi:hypothetical protein